MKTEFSRRELYALGEPLGNGATHKKPGGSYHSRILGGGGGGGGQVKYENLEKLYAMQAAQGQKLMDMAEKNVYPAYEQMLAEAKNSGSIANQESAATRADADSAASLGRAKKQFSENLASLGVNPADPRYANTMADMELQGAAQSAAAQTGARERTQQLGYAKLKDATSMGMGIPSDATSALNSAGGFASTSANMQMNQMQMDQSARGNIAALAGRMMFKDGGEVKAPSRLKCGGMVRGYKSGGIIGAMSSSAPPAPPPSGAPVRGPGAGLLQGAAQSAVWGSRSPRMAAGIEKLGEWTGSSSIQSFGAGMRLGDKAQPSIDAIKSAAEAAKTSEAAASVAPAATAPAAATGAEVGATTAGADAAAGTLAAGEAAAAPAAAVAAGGTAAELGATASAMGAGSAVAAALPWVGGALLVGGALGLFKDGGAVNKQRLSAMNSARGGSVSGPGGPKDDKVRALLSNGEFVMPVGTVKLYGTQTLEKMRQEGLAYEKELGIGVAA